MIFLKKKMCKQRSIVANIWAVENLKPRAVLERKWALYFYVYLDLLIRNTLDGRTAKRLPKYQFIKLYVIVNPIRTASAWKYR